MGILILIGALFILIAVGILIAGILNVVKQLRQTKERIPAQGTVIDLQRRVFTAGSAGVYCPVVEFAIPSGQRIRFESQFGTMPASHQVGQTLGVKYDPRDPQKAEVDSATASWFVPGCMIAMSILFFVLGALLFFIGVATIGSQ